MDKKSKALFVFIIVLIVLSVTALFYKSVILQDFIIENPVEETE